MDPQKPTPPKILIFAGSTRTGSFNRKLARAAAAALEGHGVQTTVADLRDYAMPLYDGDLEVEQGLPAGAKALKQLLRAHDGFLLASPEYNGSIPALVKNVIDWVTRPEPGEPHSAVVRGKPAALVSASPGPGGGRRGLRHLREILENIGVTVIPEQAVVPRASQAFDENGNLIRPEDLSALHQVAEHLAAAVQQKTGAAA